MPETTEYVATVKNKGQVTIPVRVCRKEGVGKEAVILSRSAAGAKNLRNYG
jgi:bifunctional DNA-binding transcriptional regulator/antitoxin component of YhaV-PrlF toxin-antitoxin module